MSHTLPPGWPAGSDWTDPLQQTFASEDFASLMQFVDDQRKQHVVHPAAGNVFNAFRFTELSAVKVMILGQDPYHGAGQAHGLSFSVVDGCPLPPSLRNIFKELQSDLDCESPASGCLKAWAKSGVFLLNTVLTVRDAAANSHRKQGWEVFTDEVIRVLNQREQPVVFILWGKPAQTKTRLIDAPQHVILTAPHPSPLSSYRGFFGSRPFSRANAELEKRSIEPIDWCSIVAK